MFNFTVSYIIYYYTTFIKCISKRKYFEIPGNFEIKLCTIAFFSFEKNNCFW